MQGPLSDITPPDSLLWGPVPGRRSAIAGFDHALYLIELVPDEAIGQDRCQVLTYRFDRPGWNKLFSTEFTRDGEGALGGGSPAVQCLQVRDPYTADDALFVCLTSPLGRGLLSIRPGGLCESIAEASPIVEAGLGSARVTELNGRLFALRPDTGGGPGRIVEYLPESGSWRPADIPAASEAGKQPISDLIAFDGALYAATTDGERGFELWRGAGSAVELNWKPILQRGAWRYAHNREVFAMVVHDASLYIVTGTGTEARRPDSKFLDYRGFEVIRVASDGAWELLIGLPRFSPAGLIVPLSGLGAGMNPGLRLEFRACASFDNRLLLGLHGVNGFQLWSSLDGEGWEPWVRTELSAIHQVDVCRAIPLAERLALELETADADGHRATRIWVAHPGGQFGD